MTEIDPIIWFTEREVLTHTPKHFVRSATPITDESKSWILNNLKGRFCVTHIDDDSNFAGFVITTLYGYPAFEDPKEAIFYELKWS